MALLLGWVQLRDESRGSGAGVTTFLSWLRGCVIEFDHMMGRGESGADETCHVCGAEIEGRREAWTAHVFQQRC